MGLPFVDFLLLAADPANAPEPSILERFWWWPFALVLVLMYFMMIRPQRNEQKKHQDALAGLKKNDRVVTIGGLYGVVMSVSKDKETNETIVTLKIDEETNAKVRVRLVAIARVIAAEAEETPTK